MTDDETIDETARVTFPPGWATGEVVSTDGYVLGTPHGQVRVFSITLDDGVCLLAITYCGGRRMARLTQETWDEIWKGEPGGEDIAELWQVWVECCQSKQQDKRGEEHEQAARAGEA